MTWAQIECALEQKVANLETSSKAHDARLKLIEYKSIDLEARSRRNNLIFRGHKENVESDNCMEIIRQHLVQQLGLSPDICIQRAHRLGNINRRPRRRGVKPNIQPRPIIVQFRDYQDVELILENAKKLRDTPFGINRDYPKEIVAARSKLWPSYKKAKENPRAVVYIGYPAKLIVNGSVREDQFPDWKNILRGSRIQDNDEDPASSEAGLPASSQNRNVNEHAQTIDMTQTIDMSQTIDMTQNSSTVPKERIDDPEVEKFDDAASMTSVRSRSRSRSASDSKSRSRSASPHSAEYESDGVNNQDNNTEVTNDPSNGPDSLFERINQNKQKESEGVNDLVNLSQYDKDMKRLESLSNQTANEAGQRTGANTMRTSDTGQKPGESKSS